MPVVSPGLGDTPGVARLLRSAGCGLRPRRGPGSAAAESSRGTGSGRKEDSGVRVRRQPGLPTDAGAQTPRTVSGSSHSHSWNERRCRAADLEK